MQKTIKSPNRWATWQQAVLSRLDNPDEVQRVLDERSRDCDKDAEESDLVRDAICTAIKALTDRDAKPLNLDPKKVKVRITAKALAELVNQATNEKHSAPKATGYAMQLQIPELRRSGRSQGRGYWWIGEHADPDRKPDATIGVSADDDEKDGEDAKDGGNQ